MVFESLIGPAEAEHRPWELFFVGILYSSLALLVSHYVFGQDASLTVVFLTTLACVPLFYNAVKLEEKKDLFITSERQLLREHGKVLTFLMFFFVGVVVSMTFWFLVLPESVASGVFATQLRDISRVQDYTRSMTGFAIAPASTTFLLILGNNLKVLLIATLFSLFYGVGSLFVLTWNATVVATAIGLFVREQTHLSVATSASLGLLRYLFHGLPEMLAYFIGGLAGGIISIAVIRHDFEPQKTKLILRDAAGLFALSIGILLLAALVEVFITPLLFYA